MTLEDGIDRWPIFALTPAEFERTVADLVQAAGREVTNWQVEHLGPVSLTKPRVIELQNLLQQHLRRKQENVLAPLLRAPTG